MHFASLTVVQIDFGSSWPAKRLWPRKAGGSFKMPAPPYLDGEGRAMERARTGETASGAAKMKRLFNRMDIFWDRCSAQETPPTEDDAWHRIKDDYKQSGLLAALLLSVIGPFAVQIPQVMMVCWCWWLEVPCLCDSHGSSCTADFVGNILCIYQFHGLEFGAEGKDLWVYGKLRSFRSIARILDDGWL